MPQQQICSARCKKFRCGQNSVQFRGKSIWCRWTDEECNPENCSYAMCMTRRLLPNGLCGDSIRRKTVDKGPDEIDIQSIKIRGKIYRKLGEKEIF